MEILECTTFLFEFRYFVEGAASRFFYRKILEIPGSQLPLLVTDGCKNLIQVAGEPGNFRNINLKYFYRH